MWKSDSIIKRKISKDMHAYIPIAIAIRNMIRTVRLTQKREIFGMKKRREIQYFLTTTKQQRFEMKGNKPDQSAYT